MPTIVVTRHASLAALLRERGVITEDARIVAHATPDDVRGARVIGVLPLALAALAESITEIPLTLTPEQRGRELTLDELRACAGEAATYTVRATE